MFPVQTNSTANVTPRLCQRSTPGSRPYYLSMRTIWRGVVVVAAVVVLGAAVYQVVHRDPVAHAGEIVGYSTPGGDLSTTVRSTTGRASHGVKTVVAFLGDDYTAGIGASTATARFSTVLCAALHLNERNFGVPRSGYANAGAGGDYSSRASDVVAARPDVVVVSGGRNDVFDDVDTVAANARDLFAELHSRLPRAVLIAVAPFWGDSAPRPPLAAVARSIRVAVLAVGGTYLGIHDPLRGHPEWMADDADPNNAGYRALAKAIKPRLAARLPARS
jgi:acyl-CoA thioesterase I